MQIKVSGALIFNQLFGGPDPLILEIEQGTLEDVLNLLCRRYGRSFEKLVFEGPGNQADNQPGIQKDRKVKQTNLILLNGEPYWNLKHGMAGILSDGDEVRFSPIMTGG